jgi:hypothetical protein
MNLDNHISILGLDVRSTNALINHYERDENYKLNRSTPIDTVKKLIDKKERELLKINNLGQKSLNHIKEKLAIHNLSLGGNLKETLYAKNMDLRDYFASKALMATIETSSEYFDSGKTIEEDILIVAKMAYMYADSMMEARK